MPQITIIVCKSYRDSFYLLTNLYYRPWCSIKKAFLLRKPSHLCLMDTNNIYRKATLDAHCVFRKFIHRKIQCGHPEKLYLELLE